MSRPKRLISEEVRRETNRGYANKHRSNPANKEKIARQVRASVAARREWYRALKSTLGCSICGESHPACVEFHHTDPSKKEFSIAHGAGQAISKERVLREIEKCDILCANCHRKLHWKE